MERIRKKGDGKRKRERTVRRKGNGIEGKAGMKSGEEKGRECKEEVEESVEERGRGGEDVKGKRNSGRRDLKGGGGRGRAYNMGLISLDCGRGKIICLFVVVALSLCVSAWLLCGIYISVIH